MTEYINKASAMSVCSSNRAYSTLQDISNLPCAKAVDREQYQRAIEEMYEERKMWTAQPLGYVTDITDWLGELEEKLFGGARKDGEIE